MNSCFPLLSNTEKNTGKQQLITDLLYTVLMIISEVGQTQCVNVAQDFWRNKDLLLCLGSSIQTKFLQSLTSIATLMKTYNGVDEKNDLKQCLLIPSICL